MKEIVWLLNMESSQDYSTVKPELTTTFLGSHYEFSYDKEHLSTTTIIFGSRGWLLYIGLIIDLFVIVLCPVAVSFCPSIIFLCPTVSIFVHREIKTV